MYVPLVRCVRSNDLVAMVEAARTPNVRPVPVSEDQALRTAVRLGHMVRQLLSVLPTDGRCLISSLVLLRLLEHRAIDARVVIGVHSEGAFGAHAWVERDSVPVLPTGRVARLIDL